MSQSQVHVIKKKDYYHAVREIFNDGMPIHSFDGLAGHEDMMAEYFS